MAHPNSLVLLRAAVIAVVVASAANGCHSATAPSPTTPSSRGASNVALAADVTAPSHVESEMSIFAQGLLPDESLLLPGAPPQRLFSAVPGADFEMRCQQYLRAAELRIEHCVEQSNVDYLKALLVAMDREERELRRRAERKLQKPGEAIEARLEITAAIRRRIEIRLLAATDRATSLGAKLSAADAQCRAAQATSP